MMLTERQKKCPIWPNYIATIDDSNSNIIHVESARAGGCYTITKTAKEMLNALDDSSRARLTTLLINQREQGVETPEVTLKLIEDAKSGTSLLVHSRADRLLKYFVDCSRIVGDEVRISYNNHDISKRMTWVQSTELDEVFAMKMWRAMALSESMEFREVFFLTTYLEEQGWIKTNRYSAEIGICVSIDGYRHINDSITTVDPAQAFVAMWFHKKMTNAYEEGIKMAVESAGYKPVRIDKKPDVNKIDDEIIAEIRRSRFLVADFTHGNDGARGGVYFEAGFALGLGIPVIYTCRKDMVDKLHFDTRQYHHIVWKKPAELCRDLKNRIQALIGEGPKKDSPVT